MCCIGDAVLSIGLVFHLTKSVAVDRELPSRVPMVEFVCPAAERIFNDYHPNSRNLGSGNAHTTSLCQVPRIVRMSVASMCVMPMIAASLCKEFWDKRLTMSPGSQLPSQKYTLTLAWLAWATADRPCDRRRDVAIKILYETAVAVGANPDHNIHQFKVAFERDHEQARE